MKPQAVGIRHQNERERNGEEDPEGKATVVGDSFQVGQKKGEQKNGDDDREREAVCDDHPTDVVALLAEERKAAARALRKDLVRPTSEYTPLLAIRAAEAQRAAKGTAQGRVACFVHRGQSDYNSVRPSSMPGIRMLRPANCHAGLRGFRRC